MIQMIRQANAFCVTWVIAAAFLTTGLAQADDSVWVRINHAVDEPALTLLGSRHSLSDYGSFQWGQISADELAGLRAAGLTVTASPNPFVLTLGGESFDPLDAAFWSSRFQPYQADPRGDFHLVQFDGPIHSSWLQSLRSSGAEPVQYIHPFAYVVWADAASLDSMRNLSAVRWAGAFLPEFRVIPEQRNFAGSIEPTNILVSRHIDLRALQAGMRDLGAEILSVTPYLGHFNILEVAAPGDRYFDLGRMAGIYTIQQAHVMLPRGEMSNRAITNSSFTSNADVTPGYASWLSSTGYDGEGVIVSIIDGGIRTSHQDLVGQIAPCVIQGSPTSCTTLNDNHGTHVAGAVAGSAASGVVDGGGFLRGQGVAPGARVVQQRYQSDGLTYSFGSSCGTSLPGYCTTPSGMLVLFREAALSGATHANNSWGSGGIKIGYDLPSQQVDVVTRDALADEPGSQPVLPVWSIQNGNGTVSGACNQNSLGSPDEAKNLFAVGSTQLIPGTFFGTVVPNPSNFFNVSGNSAHGPACDGRVGVHIVAPGCATDSTSGGSDSGYSASACGTSMASPVASGALAIFIERYRDLYGSDPSPALMKASMMGVALNMHGNQGANGQTITETPSQYQGFGRLDLDSAANPPYNVMYFDQETVLTGTGEDWSIRLVADDPAEPVRLMLVWTDAHGHGLGGSTPAWVNILDLAVDANTGTYLGNQLGSDGFSQTGGIPDDRNNMEAVFLRPDQHDGNVFDVSVFAASVTADALNPHNPGSPTQDFALVCYNCNLGVDTYTLGLQPSTLDVCLPESGNEDYFVDVSVGAIAAYAGTVTLSTAGEPDGVSSALDPTSVAAPGGSLWTLTVNDSASTGSHLLELLGDDGNKQKSAQLSLTLDAFLDSGPGLLTPTNGASDTSLIPTFSWGSLAGASDYQIQVATDSGFGSIVIDENVEDTSFVPAADLATGTEYFWRVRGENLCGGGEWSATFSFTTRLEPIAQFSASEFSFEVPQNGIDSAVLEISNIGTGNLTWTIETDQIDLTTAAGRFEGDFDVANWTLVNMPAGVNGSFNTNPGPTIELFVVGGDASTPGDTDFQIEIPMDGQIHFDWGYQSTDSGDWDRGGYAVDGVFTQLANNASQVAFFNQSRSVEVGAGDLFAFRVNTVDGLQGAGVFGVTNFVFEPDVCSEELTNVAWLSVMPTTGSVPSGDLENVTVQINTAGMAEGEYEGYLCVSTNDPNATMVPMQVLLTVTEMGLNAPVIGVDPTSLYVGIVEGGQDSQTLEISNTGDVVLNWSLDQIPAGCALPAWVEISPMSGNVPSEDSQMVTVYFNTDGLALDVYETTLCLASNDPVNPLVEIEVSMEVLSTIAVLEGTVETLGYCQDEPAPAGSTLVQVQGQSDNYTTSTNASGFYQISLPADEEPVNITISLTNHRAAAIPDVGLVAGETTVVNAGLVLRERCAQVMPAEMNFSLVTGQSDDAILTVSNAAGGEDLSWNLGTDVGCYDPMVDTWLSLSHSGGLVAWGNIREVTVSVDTDGLEEGMYEAAICLESNDAQADELVVPVELIVLGIGIFHDRFEAEEL